MKLILLFISLIAGLFKLGGEPEVVVKELPYAQIALNDSARMDCFEYGDSTLMVMTVCAPQCSSCARVYNKEGELIRTITPPISSIFPLASINKETGELIWTDNDNWEY